MQYIGKITKINYPPKEKSQSSAWASICLQTDDIIGITTSINCSGNIPNVYSFLNKNVEIIGEIINDARYGDQIKVESCSLAMILDKKSMIEFLSSSLFPKIGKVLASKIVNSFGLNTYKIIENEPNKLLDISGMSDKKLQIIKESYASNLLYKHIFQYFHGKITHNKIQKIIEYYISEREMKEEQFFSLLDENIYQIIYDIKGFGFKLVDNLALTIMDKHDKRRINASIVYVLEMEAENNGHMFCDMKTIESGCLDLLCPFPLEKKYAHMKALKNILNCWESKKEQFYKTYKVDSDTQVILNNWMNERKYVLSLMAESIDYDKKKNRIVIEEDAIYEKKLYDDECKTAQIINEMIDRKIDSGITHKKINQMIEDAELEEKRIIPEYTFSKEQIDAVHDSVNDTIHVLTGGPGTGKTTILKLIVNVWLSNPDHNVVLCAPTGKAAERMKEAVGNKFTTYTIQRMIYSNIFISSDTLVVVDETSMVDQNLACQLLKYVALGKLLFVGDIDQLPPVGPGDFFRCLVMNEHVPTTKLSVSHRNVGSIKINSNYVNIGRHLQSFIKDDLFKLDLVDKEQCQANIISEYKKLRMKYLPNQIGILLPMRKGKCGINEINKKIRDIEVKNQTEINETGFFVYDRIMNTKNMAKKEYWMRSDNSVGHGIWNGDCGTVIYIDDDKKYIILALDDGRNVSLSYEELLYFELCNAITIHKSQGSEYKAVITCMTSEHYVMLKRNLLYTSMTRAKEKLILIGDEKSLNIAIRNDQYVVRNTRLLERIG